MSTPTTSKTFGVVALVAAGWIIVQQLTAFTLALILSEVVYSYQDEASTVVYIAFTLLSLMLGCIGGICGIVNIVKESSKWLGIVALVITLLAAGISVLISVAAGLDAWA